MARILYLCVLLLAASTFGHDSPEHVVEDLTRKIKALGSKPDLLYQRAIEYRALRRYSAAAADLQRAIKEQPDSALYNLELARTYALNGQNDKALKQIDDCLRRWKQPEIYMARAEILHAIGKSERALDDVNKAFEGEPQLEWYLIRSQIEAACNKHEDRITHLEKAIEETGSGLLQIELIEAKLDAGKFMDALKQIEPELQESRWKSSWLIRRSRALKGIGEKEDSEADLRMAIHELQERIAMREEASLVGDLATAYALLGQKSQARKYLSQATKLGLPDSTAKKISKQIAQSK